MKRLLSTAAILSAFIVLPALPATSYAAAERYTLDPTHTNIVWRANHMGFSNPDGKFAEVSGTLLLDEKNPANSQVEVKVKPGSVITGNAEFDKHLKSGDFFNSGKFPEAIFKSNEVVITGKDKARVSGMLTLLGVTKPLTLDVTLNKIGENMMSKKKTAGFSATGTIRRSEFGMNYAIPAVSDEVQLFIESEAIAE